MGSGNGLVVSGNKPSAEPMLTQIVCHHITSLGHNELKPHLLTVLLEHITDFANISVTKSSITSNGRAAKNLFRPPYTTVCF